MINDELLKALKSQKQTTFIRQKNSLIFTVNLNCDSLKTQYLKKK